MDPQGLDRMQNVQAVYLGLGGKPVFADLTRFGLVMRQRQFGFPVSWDGPLSICSWAWPVKDMLLDQAHEHILMGLSHEHVLMGLAREHMLVGLAHEHMLMGLTQDQMS